MRPLRNSCEVAVIGGGIAGLSAARHAARLGRLVTLFEGSGIFGGLVATIGEVEGLPVPGEFSGQDLAIPLLAEVRNAGVQIVEAGAARISLGKRPTLTDEHGKMYNPGAIIVASGASLRRLGVPGEDELIGKGVSHCATCDGGFFRGQDVVVVGGGDGAVHEALVLARTSRRVLMVNRSPLKAKRDYIERIARRENVSFIWDAEVIAILGDSNVTGVRVRHVTDGTSSDIECTGAFPFIGVEPNTEFLPESFRTETGLVGTDSDLATTDPRLFAVGAVRAGYGGNLIQAMAEGVGAAEAAARLLVH